MRRLEDPSLIILDIQSVSAAAGVPKIATGLDANKKVSGRKRGLSVDVLGLIIGVVVLAASARDNAAGTTLLDQAAERCGMRLEKARVDQGFKGEVVIHGAWLDVTIEVVRPNRADQGKGFVPQPKRWVVEQTNATLLLHRRPAREYDHLPDTSASRAYWASTANMTRRLTTPSPTWRDTLGWLSERHRTPHRPPGPARRGHRPGRGPTRSDRVPHRCSGRERSAPCGSGHHSKNHHGAHTNRSRTRSVRGQHPVRSGNLDVCCLPTAPMAMAAVRGCQGRLLPGPPPSPAAVHG